MPRALRRRRTPRRDAGFSLVELVVAMMIIAVALMVLVAVQIRAAIVVTEARKLSQATAFGNEAIEQMHSIPWNTLSRGLYSGYLTAAGGDSLVSGGYLNVDAMHAKLIVAAAPNDQHPSATNVARPLYDRYGSNKQTRDDPSLVGVLFTVKAYVVEPTAGPSTGIVGIVVVVEWPGRNGTEHTTIYSEAYRGADSPCGNADTQPFLAACQTYFEATSSSGSVTVGVSAVNIDADPLNIAPQPLMVPAAGPDYTLAMQTASASAHLRSQQVNYVDGMLEYGGNTNDDNDPDTAPTARGYANQTLRATDDVTNQEGILPNPPTLTFTQSSGAEPAKVVSQSGSPVSLHIQSDYQRTGTVIASTQVSCLPGKIPAGQPCASASLANDSATETTGSGHLVMYVDGDLIRLSRRLSNEAAGPTIGNTDLAWVARLASASGSSDIGCTTLTGSGCVAAGATRTNAVLSIGKVIDGTTWGGAATDGMVQIRGASGCTYYTDSVRVQRGTSQKTTAPTVSRCGQLRYWNGTDYTAVTLTTAALAEVTTAPVTWTDGTNTVTATSEVQVLGAVITNPTPTDPNCITAACNVSVSAGSIVIVSTYHIQWAGHEHLMVVTTTVTGSGASASYRAAPGA